MFYCNHLNHPSLNDPGTSQAQRVSDDLLISPPQIDDRKMADLLNYFRDLSKQVNFYNPDLSVSDWEQFFENSLPFLLSNIASYDIGALNENLTANNRKFASQPTVSGLQLFFNHAYFSAIAPIHNWSQKLKNSNTNLESDLQKIIRDRLVLPLKSFISWMNTAVRCFGIKTIDLSGLASVPVWGLSSDDLTAYDESFSCTIKSVRSQMLLLQSGAAGSITEFTGVIAQVSSGAATIVNQDLDGLLQKSGLRDVSPHLALLFSFLKQFQLVQGDLNKFTQGTIDYFFQKVLQLAPSALVPDKAYIVFNIQKQLSQFPLDAGRPLKDGKDNKQADVIFTLDEDIVVNQTQTTDFRTLFLNNEKTGEIGYVEGVYMAPDATKADGLTQAFKDPSNASWPTLGDKITTYIPPGATNPVNYPAARLGFILSSKVLLMNEGTRNVKIQLVCQWKDLCGAADADPNLAGTGFRNKDCDFFGVMSEQFSGVYFVVDSIGINKAVALGLSEESAQNIEDAFLRDHCKKSLCEDGFVYYKDQKIISEPEWIEKLDRLTEKNKINPAELSIIGQVFKKQRVFDIQFSGDKSWVTPDIIERMEIEMLDSATGIFLIYLDVTINVNQTSPITFFNNDKLGEDFSTTDPLVKIQLNDALKIEGERLLQCLNKNNIQPGYETCCLYKPVNYCGRQISFYTFFRDVVVLNGAVLGEKLFETFIHVNVCGVKKNIVVQNDDNVLDVNKAFTPFGVKPVVADFDVFPLRPHDSFRHKKHNLVGPNFYIGSTEIFLKKWDRVCVNINWKDLPTDLFEYYKAYFVHPPEREFEEFKINPEQEYGDFKHHQVNFAVLHSGKWIPENGSNTEYSFFNDITQHFNRKLFDREDGMDLCESHVDFKHSFDLHPADFGDDLQLTFDKNFALFTKYAGDTLNGFIRLTLENQDFLHKIYQLVLAYQITEQARGRESRLPNEPWTPMIQGMSIDYKATATIRDINLIQLYPFAGTYKSIDISAEPFLFASFCDEGTLFIGLNNLVPGENVNILFRFAEATADSEETPETVNWQYLTGNQWKNLRSGFELLDDKTKNLTSTGIIKFSLPDDISNANSVMPSGLYWIKASVPENSKATSQTIGVVSQAVLATFLNNPDLNDQTRPGTPLASGSINKLLVPDASVTKVIQPYDSFGGKAPEASINDYYLRVSEQLRHKGRAIQKWDYEHIVLQQFPQILRVKCIPHSYFLSSHVYRNDFPMAPGNILLAVLPDTSQLIVANAYQPTVPVSLLGEIEDYLSNCSSAFIRLFVKNPRYEPVNFCITIKLGEGRDKNYFRNKLEQDIQGWFAPWLNADPDDFQFAKRLYLSAIVSFIKSRDYIDFLLELNMCHEGENMSASAPPYIDPLSPRSILIAGIIEIILLDQDNPGNINKPCRNESKWFSDYRSDNKREIAK